MTEREWITSEREWLTSEDPLQLLAHVHASLEARKAHLVTAACFRRHWERLPAVAQEWARLAEAAAEGKASRQDLDDAFEKMEESLNALGPPGEFVALLDLAYGMWQSNWVELQVVDEHETAWRFERKAQASLVRDVFGNPFRPVTLQPAWTTEAVQDLARRAYAGNRDRLSLLADALERAGCDNAELLGHCREPGAHVRGCWVLDMLVGHAWQSEHDDG
jgi:hypothetical protein